MKHVPIPVAALAALALALAACTSGDDPSQDTAEPAPEATPAPSADDVDGAEADDTAAETGAVTVVGLGFEPRTITVAAGDTVTWVNEDPIAHTATAGDPDSPEAELFDVPLDPEGGSGEVTFDEPGEYRYFCEIHQPMRGTVVVE